MGQTPEIALVETEDALAVDALDALAVGLVDWSAIWFVKSYTARCLIECFLCHFSLEALSHQRVLYVHQFGLVRRDFRLNYLSAGRGPEPGQLLELENCSLSHSLAQLLRLDISIDGQVRQN